MFALVNKVFDTSWLIALSLSLFAPNWAVAVHTESFHFNVTLDEKKFGTHSFIITPSNQRNDELKLQSIAKYRFKVLFVTAYRYDHEAEELWRDGCLVKLNSTTFDDGENTAVSTTIDATQNNAATLSKPKLKLSIHGPDPTTAALTKTVEDPCPGTFAYWSLPLLQRDRLINAQTGDVEPASFARQGSENWAGMNAVKYRLSTPEAGDIFLWYRQSDNRWIGLQTEVDGRTLTYAP